MILKLDEPAQCPVTLLLPADRQKRFIKEYWTTGYGITATRRFFTMTTGAGASLREASQDGDSPDNTGLGSLGALATAFAISFVFNGTK